MNMEQLLSEFVFEEVGVGRLESIRPLWEALKRHHVKISPRFAPLRMKKTFDDRKKDFLIKSCNGRFKLFLVHQGDLKEPLAYCIASITTDGAAEIDSLFVVETFRSRGIGTELMRRTLSWFEEQGPVSRIVMVAHGNDDALRFYERFGFYPDNLCLRQSV